MIRLRSHTIKRIKEMEHMTKKVKKREMMVDDNNELEDSQELDTAESLASLEDLYQDDPFLIKFLQGMKNVDGDLALNDYIDQFIDQNSDIPGMDLFLRLLKRGPLPDRLLEVEKMLEEQRKSFDEEDWDHDEAYYNALDSLLMVYLHTISLYEMHCMYKPAISCAFEALEIAEYDTYGFLSSIMHNYVQIQDIDRAEEFYKILKKAQPDLDAEILLPLSVLYFTLGNYQRSYEVLNELVDTNEDTVSFIMDWEDGFDSLQEKMVDYAVGLYDEELEYYTYDSFVKIWVYYYKFSGL